MLPEWLKSTIPSPRPSPVIEKTDSGYTVELGGSIAAFESIVDAYDYAETLTQYRGVTAGSRLQSEENYHIGMYFCPAKADRKRLLLFLDDTDRISMIEDDYEMFLKAAEEYRADKSNFQKAFKFLSYHPCYWVYEDQSVKGADGFTWKTERSVADFYPTFIDTDGDNGYPKGYYWMIETGEHTDDYRHHYFNPELTATGSTIESAFINLAENIDNAFDDEGIAKPPHQDSDIHSEGGNDND